ncbi:MAG: 4Fe-4S dicluster domain-containing protein [Candidatus Marinimicrobia bacterium]|nr:4Fe-4S dicluster domain-containing protein [Candidatus Neomarinimicrobiota bacterium]MDD5582942.1 4Fe-4S dicluster domain-containing protein [Candidatus Neomarinimicrobiota bacterium]
MSESKGHVIINTAECKGCQLCIEACPIHVITLSNALNHMGYKPAMYIGERCTGCGICFYTCPEPGAITVFKGWDTWEEKAMCPTCKKETKVYHPKKRSDVILCTQCLNPIP